MKIIDVEIAIWPIAESRVEELCSTRCVDEESGLCRQCCDFDISVEDVMGIERKAITDRCGERL